MDVGRGEQADPAVAVRRVVPGEERVAERPGVLERAEALREGRPVLEGPELGLAERVVNRQSPFDPTEAAIPASVRRSE
jgi:hypothetical protein